MTQINQLPVITAAAATESQAVLLQPPFSNTIYEPACRYCLVVLQIPLAITVRD